MTEVESLNWETELDSFLGENYPGIEERTPRTLRTHYEAVLAYMENGVRKFTSISEQKRIAKDIRTARSLMKVYGPQ